MDLLVVKAEVKTFSRKVTGPLYSAQQRQNREKVSVTYTRV